MIPTTWSIYISQICRSNSTIFAWYIAFCEPLPVIIKIIFGNFSCSCYLFNCPLIFSQFVQLHPAIHRNSSGVQLVELIASNGRSRRSVNFSCFVYLVNGVSYRRLGVRCACIFHRYKFFS